jgi:PAS domain S-box-containing protein
VPTAGWWRTRRGSRRLRRELASIAEATSDLALIGLPDGQVHWLNASARAVLGFTADEDVHAYRIEDVFPPEELERIYRDVMPAVVERRRWQGELVLCDRAGREVPVWGSMYAHHDRRGERRYVSALLRDLRGRRQEEERLRESERRLAEAQHLAGIGSWELHVATGDVTFSDEMHRIYGTTPATFRPTLAGFLARVHPDDVDGVRRAVEDALAGDGRYRAEFRIVRPDATVRTVDARGVTTFGPDGTAERMAGTNQDVTELREAERLKRDLVAVVSHELRTPLTSVHGALRLLQSDLLTADPVRARRMVDIAESNTGRLQRLIDDILDVERLATPEAELHRRPVTLDGLAVRAVETMQAMADEAAVELVTEVPPVTVEGDADRLLQVLTNLLSNAVKFSPAGTTVRVTGDVVGAEVQLRVEDEGRGIPADQLARVFDRFHQVDPSDARERGGTGLGLAICQGLVTQHAGRIWAESLPGAGATFVVALPLGAAVRAGRVLVCDDDEDARAAIAVVLRASGYQVDEVADGEEALRLARSAPPDAIVLDLLMPGVDGWETVRRLQRSPTTAAIPVIVTSVLTEVETGDLMGAVQDHVDKATGPLPLLDAVDRAVAGAPRLVLIDDDETVARRAAAQLERPDLQIVPVAAAERVEQVVQLVGQVTGQNVP